MNIRMVNWGKLEYEVAWRKQQKLVQDRIKGTISDTFILVEHPPVITLGKKSFERKTLKENHTIRGIPVYSVERGGEATYHGPGQIVIYPILHLPIALGPKHFLRVLEESIIQTLGEYNIRAFRIQDATGVWVLDTVGKERKVASLGIAVRNSVTYHGLALNFHTDLSAFQSISPCGFSPQVMINMKDLLDSTQAKKLDRKEIEALLLKYLTQLYEKAKKDPSSFLKLPCHSLTIEKNANKNPFLGAV